MSQPQRRGSKSADQQNSTCICPLCSKNVNNDSNGIQCDHCDAWFHARCLKIDKTVIEFFAQSKSLFFCPTCLPTAKKIFEMERRVDSVEHSISELNAKFDAFTRHVDAALASRPAVAPSENLCSMIRSVVVDTMEADSKKNNAVLLNFETNDDTTLLDDVRALADEAGADSSAITNVRRMPPPKTQQNRKSLPGIVKVFCTSSTAQKNFIRLVNAHSRADGNHDNTRRVRVRPDLTFLQREAGRKLRAELDEKRQAGENNWMINYKKNCLEKKHLIHKA